MHIRDLDKHKLAYEVFQVERQTPITGGMSYLVETTCRPHLNVYQSTS